VKSTSSRERDLSSVTFVDSLRSLSPEGKPRDLLLRTAEILDSWRPGQVVLLTAPTGYGKTTLSLSLANAVISGNRELAERVIHVLPLRSIGDDLFIKAERAFRGLKPFRKYVGLQHMGRMDSPLLGRRFNITTLDTFVLSFFKLPPYELHKVVNKYDAHYEVSRGFILSSLVVFDEVHLFLTETKSATAFVTSLESLVESNVPVVLSTATLPVSHLEELRKRVEAKGGELLVVGPKADDSPKREVRVMPFTGDWLDKAKELSKEKSLLIVTNTVKRAVEFFKDLKNAGLSPLLLHGRMTERHRQNVLSRVLGEDRAMSPGTILVATQVIEAGVDISAGSMITEVSPVESLLQRMGRVARYEGESGEVYVIRSSDNVYEGEKVDEAWKMVENGKLEVPQGDVLKLNNSLHRALWELHRNVFTGSKTALKLLEEECSFTRSGELIKVVPEERLASLDEGDYLALERGTLKRAKDKIVGGLRRGPEGVERVQLSEDFYPILEGGDPPCLSLWMMRNRIDSLVVKGYDEEVGFVG